VWRALAAKSCMQHASAPRPVSAVRGRPLTRATPVLECEMPFQSVPLASPDESNTHFYVLSSRVAKRRQPIHISSTRTCRLAACLEALQFAPPLLYHGDPLYQIGSPASPAKLSHCFGGIQSPSATCRLPRRVGGCGTLTAELIVFGLRTRVAGSTKMAQECRMLQHRPKRSAVHRMRHHYYVQERQQLSEYVEPIVPINRETQVSSNPATRT
jgi:hypothetical protein